MAFRDAHRAAFHSRLGRDCFSATGSQLGFDAMTNRGLGLAFFIPSLAVSSLSVEAFRTTSGVAILWNERLRTGCRHLWFSLSVDTDRLSVTQQLPSR